MLKLKQKGIARHIGVSNFQVHHIEALYNRFPDEFPQLQAVEISPCNPGINMVRFCHSKGIEVIARYDVSMQNMPYNEKETWLRLAKTIADQHRQYQFECGIPTESAIAESSSQVVTKVVINMPLKVSALVDILL